MSRNDTKETPTTHDRILGGIIGLVVGDALGVPVEFQPRARLDAKPVTGMIGHGTHGQPPGTWSDDSSLALATLASLLEGYNPADMMARFSRWRSEGYMTPHGEVFDIGPTTSAAIGRFDQGRDQTAWGGASDRDNGNGSLMRILPLSLYVCLRSPDDIIAAAFEVSALTHAHIRSRLCCAYYSLLVRHILEGASLPGGMELATEQLMPLVPTDERTALDRILTGAIIDEPRNRVRSGGYVVDCLEASLWCTSRHANYVDTVLAAVNLGDDTDTTAAVTGGLAGVMYGIHAIPKTWREAITRDEEVMAQAETFAGRCLKPHVVNG